MNTPRVDTKISRVQGEGVTGGGKATWHVNSQHVSIRLYCMSNSSLGHKEQKIQLHEIHIGLTFRSRDKGQNNKRSLTFCTGVKFSSCLISMRMGSN